MPGNCLKYLSIEREGWEEGIDKGRLAKSLSVLRWVTSARGPVHYSLSFSVYLSFSLISTFFKAMIKNPKDIPK